MFSEVHGFERGGHLLRPPAVGVGEAEKSRDTERAHHERIQEHGEYQQESGLVWVVQIKYGVIHID